MNRVLLHVASVAVGATALIGLAAAGPANAQSSMGANASTAAAATSNPASAKPNTVAHPNDVDGQCHQILGDGVRIRAWAGGPVNGLAYLWDPFRVDAWSGGWAEGLDWRTGVHGWVSAQFVGFANCGPTTPTTW